MATYALSLLPSIFMIVWGTWRFTSAKGWPATLGVILSIVQALIVVVAALFWMAVLAMMFSPYK